MSWKSGGELFGEVWAQVSTYIPEKWMKVYLCQDLILLFSKHDCDNFYDCYSEDFPEIEEAHKRFLKEK